MAIIADDDKLQQDPNQQAQGQGAPGISAGGPTTVSGGQSSADVGSPVSTAGVGAGGTGGWTNIQAYIDANKGDTGSAQALDKTVNDQFGNEKNAYTQDSSKFLGDAQKQVDSAKIDNTQADQLLKHAGSNYAYGGSPSLDYSADVNKAKGALNSQYSGPNSYAYGLTDKTQEYGNDLNNNQGFDALMKHVYQQAAPGGLNSGQAELQKQLDVNNQGLVDKRKNLQGAYTALGADRDNVVKNTTSSLGGLANQYGANQNALRDYLTGKQNSLGDAISGEEAAAKSAYGDDYKNTPAGVTFPSSGSFSGMSGLQDFVNGSNIYKNWRSGDSHFSDLGPTFSGYQPALDQFYSSENQKYANTADEDKRQYNALLDFLGQTNGAKSQGFTVKG